MENKCPICGREAGGVMQDHHLKPVTFKSRDKTVHCKDNLICIHKVCHQKIHATFGERDLFHFYNTVRSIIEHTDMRKFIKWIGKKPLDYYDKNDDTKSRKRKRKR